LGLGTVPLGGVAAKPLGFTYVQPVCRFIHGSLETLWIYEGLQEHQRMAKVLLPVPGQPFLAQRQNARGQIRNMPLRQDQKTAVVGQELQTILLMAEAPSDPAIPCPAFPGCGGKAQKGDPFIVPGGDTP